MFVKLGYCKGKGFCDFFDEYFVLRRVVDNILLICICDKVCLDNEVEINGMNW